MRMRDLRIYYMPACAKWTGINYHLITEDHCLAFGKFIGSDEYYKFHDRPALQDYDIKPELKRLCLAIIGPHGDTILKMHKIQKESKNDA